MNVYTLSTSEHEHRLNILVVLNEGEVAKATSPSLDKIKTKI